MIINQMNLCHVANARQRIVSEHVDMVHNLVISVSVIFIYSNFIESSIILTGSQRCSTLKTSVGWVATLKKMHALFQDLTGTLICIGQFIF
jgi:hypothetical protein